MSKNEKRNTRQKLYKISAHKQNSKKLQDGRQLKDRFLEAVVKGELGSVYISGAVVTLKEFKAFFSDITTQYVSSFMPASTFEPGRLGLHIQNSYFECAKVLILFTLMY